MVYNQQLANAKGKKIHYIIGAKKKNMYMPFPTLPLLKPVSVLLEVPFSIFVSPFKSVSVNCDTESLGP